jgi:hypothetical protein
VSGVIKVPAQFTGIRSKVDRTYSLTFNTREIPGDTAADLLKMAMDEVWLLISPDNSLDAVDVPKYKADSGANQKTPSERLRAVYWVWHKQLGITEDFDLWYAHKMSGLVEQIKAKLDNEDVRA